MTAFKKWNGTDLLTYRTQIQNVKLSALEIEE